MSAKAIYNSKPIEIESGKVLNINKNLTDDQEQRLVQLLRKYKESFTWGYPYIKGIDPQLCMHHNYTEKDVRPIHQPQ